MEQLGIDGYNRPRNCKQCNGVMVFKGVGEYRCEDCNAVEYDDYGKVRLYIEKNKGATAWEVEKATGVSQRSIRQMLREERIAVAQDSKVFLKCELCNKPIRIGRFCPECEVKYHQNLETRLRAERNKDTVVVGMGQTGESGAKRFKREW